MRYLTTILILLTFSCKKKQEITLSEIKKDSVTTEKIFCDSLYKNKNYQVIFSRFLFNGNYDKNDNNSVFILHKIHEKKEIELYRDSIQTDFGNIWFEDFNGDNIKDILVENISDVRSNLTYNLYIVDLQNDKLRKIKNFNNIKNPNYLKKYDLIDNRVMSGRNWTAFYKIVDDSIKSFEEDEYLVYWGQDENGNPANPEKEYELKLRKVIKQTR